MYNERLGKIHFWLMFPAFYIQSIGQMLIGLNGMNRRIANYDHIADIPAVVDPHMWITIAGYVIGTSVLIFVYNAIVSIRKGAVAGNNPWNSRSPEFQVASPMPVHNYDHPFEVVGEPYDYGLDEPYVNMNPAGAGD